MDQKNIFKTVLIVGPCCDANGGISSVIKSYRENFPGLNFVFTFRCFSDSKLKKILVFLRAVGFFLYCLVVKKIKIVHIHSASWNSFFRKSCFLMIAKLFRKKVVFHIHSGDFFDKFFVSYPLFCKKILGWADSVIVVSSVWKERLEKLELSVPIFSVGNFVDLPTEIASPGECKK